jgi:hypothetical protein
MEVGVRIPDLYFHKQRSWNVGKTHDHGYGTVGVRPHDRGMFVEELLQRQSGVINRQRALAEGLSKVRDHAEGLGRNVGTGPARSLLGVNCEPKVPTCLRSWKSSGT